MDDFLIVTNTSKNTFCDELSKNKEIGYRVAFFVVTGNGSGIRYTALMEIDEDAKTTMANRKAIDQILNKSTGENSS